MIDRFEYRSPMGWLGRAADLLFLERYMRSLLGMRNRHIKAAAEEAFNGGHLPTGGR